MRIVPNKFLVKIGVYLLLVSGFTMHAQINPPPPPGPPGPPGFPIDNWIPVLFVVGLIVAFYKFKNIQPKKTLK